jgi:WD40 repeat protein
VRSQHKHTTSLKSLRFVRQTDEIALADADGKTNKWSPATGQVTNIDPNDPLIADLQEPTRAHSPDGTIVALVRDLTIHIREAAKVEGQKAIDLEALPSKTETSNGVWITRRAGHIIRCIALSPKADRIAVGELGPPEDNDSTGIYAPTARRNPPRDVLLRVYDLANIDSPRTLECGNRQDITSLAFSSDGSELFAAVDRDVMCWDSEPITPPSIDELPDRNTTLCYDRSGKLLATIHNHPPRVVLRDVLTGTPRRTLPGSCGKIYDVAFDTRNQTIAAACGQGVETWDVETGALKKHYSSGKACFRVRFDPTGSYLAGAGWDVTVWDVQTGAVRHIWRKPTFREWNREVAPRPRGGRDGRGAPFKEENRPYGSWTAAIAFTPDGRQFAMGHQRGGVQCFNTNDWGKTWETDPGFTIITLAFSRDGKYLAGCGGSDHRIWFWDAATGAVAKTVVGPGNTSDVGFSDDGSRMITGHGLWDTTTGIQLLRLDGGQVAAISPDGRQIATGGGKVTIW